MRQTNGFNKYKNGTVGEEKRSHKVRDGVGRLYDTRKPRVWNR